MRSSPPIRDVGRAWAAALFALLVAGWLAPTAGAGCVHDALRRAEEPSGAAHFRLLIAAGAMITPQEALGEASGTAATPDPEVPPPCDGPRCTRQQGIPSTPGAWVEPASPTWAWGGLADARCGLGSGLLPQSGPRLRPVSVPIAVFHPPRPALHD